MHKRHPSSQSRVKRREEQSSLTSPSSTISSSTPRERPSGTSVRRWRSIESSKSRLERARFKLTRNKRDKSRVFLSSRLKLTSSTLSASFTWKATRTTTRKPPSTPPSARKTSPRQSSKLSRLSVKLPSYPNSCKKTNLSSSAMRANAPQ